MRVLLVSDKNRKLDRNQNIVFFPTIETVPIDFELKKPSEFDVLIFTSQKAVKFFFEKINPEIFKGKTFLCVGEKTKKALNRYGFGDVLVPEENTAEGIVHLVLSKLEDFKGKKFLFPRTKQGRKVIVEKLQDKIDIYPLDIYETRFNNPDNKGEIKELLKENKIKAVVFTSPLTFESFVKLFEGKVFELLRGKKIATVGKTTKKTVESYGFNVDFCPEKADIEYIIKALTSK